MKTITLTISGMHCTSCAMNIDGELEDLGVSDVQTNYAKGESVVTYDEDVVTLEQIHDAITRLGYSVSQS